MTCRVTGAGRGDAGMTYVGGGAESSPRRIPELAECKVEPNSGQLPDILEVFAGLEPNGTTRGNADFLAGARVAADATLAGLYLEDAKPSQLNAIAALHGETHGVKDRIDCHLSLDLGDVSDLRNLINDVNLDHGWDASKANTVNTIKIIT